jgi:DNA-binding transcriptional MerR regulator
MDMDRNPARIGEQLSDEDARRARHKCEPSKRLVRPALRGAGALDRFSTIREMARDFGVSIRALRFYEDRGLLHPRREGTARYYSAREKLHLKMILKGKQLGFTLSEIHDMLASREEAGLTRGGDRDFGEWDLDEGNLEMGLPPEQIIAQIDHLERQRRELDAAIVALRTAHRRLLESPCRAAMA